MSDDGALDAAAGGERSTGQVCPLIGIKREGLRIQFLSIDNQDSLVGDNIVLGSPGGQCPVLVSSLGSDAAGQETIAAGFYSLQGGSGQQGLATVQFNRNALSEGNAFQFKGNSIFQVAASMSNISTINATAWFIRQRSDGQHDADHEKCQSNT